MFLKHAQLFFGQRGYDPNSRGGRRNFNSKGRGFIPVVCYNDNHNPQKHFLNLIQSLRKMLIRHLVMVYNYFYNLYIKFNKRVNYFTKEQLKIAFLNLKNPPISYLLFSPP